jgi:hypothetical protein
MIIKITRENSSYRHTERQRQRKKTYIFLKIFVETNQPTNQQTPLRASSYLPRLKLPPPIHGSKAPLAGWLAGSSHARFVWWMARLEIFFERKKSQSESQSVRNTYVSVSLYPVTKTVWGASEPASLQYPLGFPLSSRLWVLSSLLLRASSSSRLKRAQTASVPGCSYVPYVPTYHVWHFF